MNETLKESIDGVKILGKCIVCGGQISKIEVTPEIKPLAIKCEWCGKEYIN